MRFSILALVLFAFYAPSSVAGTGGDYRLAGTIALGEEKFLAIVEMPSGEQRIIHEGDEFDSGIVVLITQSETRIRLPDDEMVLTLVGTDSNDEPNIFAGPMIATFNLSEKQLMSIQTLRSNNEEKLVATFSSRLALPQGLRVRRIWASQQEFASLTEALPALKDALARGDIPHLFFEPGSGLDEIYLKASTNLEFQ